MVRDAENSAIYLFDGFRVDAKKRLVYGPEGNPVPLKAKAFDTLLFLVENSGRVVDRDELLAAIWPDTVVEENNLTQHISSLRRTFGEKPDDHRFIATVPGRGYMFVAEVRGDRDERDSISSETPTAVPRGRLLLFVTIVIASLLVVGFIYRYRTQSDAAGSIRSIAVLPFKPLVDSDSNPALEMGMSNALISKLAESDGLSVPQFSVVKKFASPGQDAIQAGLELGVEAVLDGTVQVSAGRVRVSVTLMSVADSKQLWADRFDNELTDIFAVQESISERVANALRIKLSANAKKRYTDNVEAYQLYLEGQFHKSKLSPDEIKRGLEYFQQAVATDPNYALAYSGISDCYLSFVLSIENPPTESARNAIAAGERAVELDPQLAEGHRNRGITYFWFERDWLRAEAAYKRALELDPNSAFTHLHYAHLLSNIGRYEEAVVQAEEGRKLDPYTAYSFTIQGIVYHQTGNRETAVERLDEAIKRNSTFWLAHLFKAIVYTDLKRNDLALQSAQFASQANATQTISPAYESVALARLGRRDEAKRILGSLLERSRQGYVPPYHIAIAYIGLDDRENSLAWLEKSFSENDAKIVFLKVDHIWDPLRSEPRFAKLMKDMKLE